MAKTPPAGFTHMLVFSQGALPDIFQSLIVDYQPTLRDAEPAKSLYMLARFACLHCDQNWIEDLIIGATDTIEETFFVSDSNHMLLNLSDDLNLRAVLKMQRV